MILTAMFLYLQVAYNNPFDWGNIIFTVLFDMAIAGEIGWCKK